MDEQALQIHAHNEFDYAGPASADGVQIYILLAQQQSF
jgi:hypothetical protein